MPDGERESSAAPNDAPEVDPALTQRTNDLVVALTGSDDDGVRQPLEADLIAIGAAALDRLLFAMTDDRLRVAARARAGTLAGVIGDPRLAAAGGLGPVIRVTSGSFRMGAREYDPEASSNSLPQHDVDLASYSIARYPVTNTAFAHFVEDGGYDRPDAWLPEGWQWRTNANVAAPHYWLGAQHKPNHPVVGVSWFEAMAFCAWMSARLSDSGDLRPGEEIRLPTEAEWEKAARGGSTLDRRRSQANNMPQRRFPWGDAFLAAVANTAEGGLGSTSPVGMYPSGSSPYKVEDLGGNVLEWCSSRPGAYPYHSGDGRESTDGGTRTYRVGRGGAWAFGGDSAGCAYRHWNRADFRGGMVGFRVVQGYPLL